MDIWLCCLHDLECLVNSFSTWSYGKMLQTLLLKRNDHIHRIQSVQEWSLGHSVQSLCLLHQSEI